jgi:hypothetical protein
MIASIGALGALAAWLLAVPMEAKFTTSGAAELPYAPDAWAPTYHWIHQQVGEPFGLTQYYFGGSSRSWCTWPGCCWRAAFL